MKTIPRWFLILSLAAFVMPSLAAAAGKRVALVIGNSDYEQSPLKNPVNDATDISEALRELGFDVITRTNAGRREMFTALREFREKLRGSDATGLFYFAGHGAQYQGRNYLLPVDHQVRAASELRIDSINAEDVLAQMEAAGNPVNVVILDACRNQPFPGSSRDGTRGLARMDAISGSLVAYATSPGSVAEDGTGRNGVYTGALLNHLKQPGLSLTEMFNKVGLEVSRQTSGRQEPWVSSSPLPTIYLAGAPSGDSGSGITGLGDAETEITFWQSIAGSTECADYEAYVSTYPSGRFIRLAESRRDRYCAPTQAPASTPEVELAGGMDVRNLLEECDEHLRANRVTTGRGGNALDCYVEALQIDPGNKDALGGLTAIEDKYIGWVNREIGRRNADRAGSFLERLKGVNTDRPEVGELESALASLIEEQSRPVAPSTPAAPATPVQRPRKSFEPEMVSVKGGCFQMGSPASEEGRDHDERQHRVCVEDFAIGKYEVTQSEWQAVMGNNPAAEKGDRRPVENVSWNDVQSYVEKLNARTGKNYRLLTEAEWEYACRSGGRDERYCGGSDLGRLAWYARNSGYVSHEVGGKQPNGLGLYDMSGNVWEWTCSVYGGAETRCASQQDTGSRVLRGGSFGNRPAFVRAAYRNRDEPTNRNDNLGFRLAQDN